jgi:septum site-determining protein MinD
MDMIHRGDMMSVDDVADILAVHVIGAVPDDENIVISTNQGEPLVDTDCLCGQAFYDISRRISGEEVPFLELDRQRGLLIRISGFLRRA